MAGGQTRRPCLRKLFGLTKQANGIKYLTNNKPEEEDGFCVDHPSSRGFGTGVAN